MFRSSSQHFVLCVLLLLGCRSAPAPTEKETIPITPIAPEPTSAPVAAAKESPAAAVSQTPDRLAPVASAPASLAASVPTSMVAAGPPVYLLPVTTQQTTLKRVPNKDVPQDPSSVELRGFSVKMRDKALEKKINARVKMPAKPDPSLFGYAPEVGVAVAEQGCDVGIATEALISWSCGSGGILTKDRVGQTVGTFNAVNYLLVDGSLKTLALDDLFVPGWEETLWPLVKAEGCLAPLDDFLITSEGLNFYWDPIQGGSSNPPPTTIRYEELASLLKPGGPISLVQQATEAPKGYFDKDATKTPGKTK